MVTAKPVALVALADLHRMKTLQEQLEAAGLVSLGPCGPLSSGGGYGSDLQQISPLLQDMTPQEVDVLVQTMLLVKAEAGQVLIREGDVGEWMLLLLKGTVDVTKAVGPRLGGANRGEMGGENGGEKGGEKASLNDGVVNDAEPGLHAGVSNDDTGDAALSNLPGSSRIAVIQRGAAVGEMSMLDSEPRFATCTAIEAVEAAVLGRRELALLIRDHPAVGAKLLVKITQLMAQRLRNTSNHLVRLLQK